MSQDAAPQTTFASGRYSKRKRTQVNYRMEEMDVDETDLDFEEDFAKPKKQRKPTTSKRLPKRDIFPFLELPAEIRNMIYSYALTDPSGINFVAVQRNKRRCVERVSRGTLQSSSSSRSPYQSNRINDGNTGPKPLVPSLLAVNKQIHQEGCDILYSNELVFADTVALYAFMINIGPASGKHLKNMRLKSWVLGRTGKAYNNACFAALVWATNLKKFHIDTRISWHGSPKHAAQQLYRDAFPWLEAVGHAKGRYDAAVDVVNIDPSAFNHGWRSTTQPGQEKIKAFNAELSRNLGMQQKRVMSKSVKRRKISKDGYRVVLNAQPPCFNMFSAAPSPAVSTWGSPVAKLTSWLFSL